MMNRVEDSAMNDRHITSIVVHTRPDVVGTAADLINRMDEAEVHVVSETGKLVVSLETDTLDRVTEVIGDINKMPGVVNALLVYHHVEDAQSLDVEMELTAPTGVQNTR